MIVLIKIFSEKFDNLIFSILLKCIFNNSSITALTTCLKLNHFLVDRKRPINLTVFSKSLFSEILFHQDFSFSFFEKSIYFLFLFCLKPFSNFLIFFVFLNFSIYQLFVCNNGLINKKR